jgi:uncharacterized protein
MTRAQLYSLTLTASFFLGCSAGTSPDFSEREQLRILADMSRVTQRLGQHRDGNGQSLLHLAAMRNHPRVAGFLLDNGAHPFEQDYMGVTPMEICARRGSLDVAKVILEGEDWLIDEELTVAINEGRAEMVELFIKHGADVCKEVNGETPLLRAATNLHDAETNPDRLRILKRLLGCPNCEHTNVDIDSALYSAVRSLYFPAVQVLLQAGARVDGLDDRDYGLMHVCADQRQSETNAIPIARALAAAGAPINTEALNGKTPLELAEINGHSELAKTLRELGAKVRRTQNEN